MIRIRVNNAELTAIDETPTHYICEPPSNLSGYLYISKVEATVVPLQTLSYLTELNAAIQEAEVAWRGVPEADKTMYIKLRNKNYVVPLSHPVIFREVEKFIFAAMTAAANEKI